MPIDLESSMSLEDLLLDLADKVGLASHGSNGTSAPTIPDDEADRARLIHYINAGYKLFLRDDPDWTFLEIPVSITFNPDGDGPFNVAGDAGRYRLPHPVRSRPRGNWVYQDQSSVFAQVIDYAPRRVEIMRQANGASGIPEYCGCRRLPVTDGTEQPKLAWEALFYPKPSSVLTVTAPFRVVPYNLVELHERHVCGADHDHSIVAAAWYLWELKDETEPGSLALATADKDNAFAASKELDGRNRTRRYGRMRDPSIRTTTTGSRRARGLITEVGGNPVP